MPLPPIDELLGGAGNLAREKWDLMLPDELLHAGFERRYLDLAGAQRWAAQASTAIGVICTSAEKVTLSLSNKINKLSVVVQE
ncbi:hypothetical protein [Sinimarinibacterium flocculans]|uniref:hypothetical protein n=1 Tax=Sinimarinibacterium flocculans TaxID=985250 RepID=UPI0024938CC1|nr:hypothetical protein [Sinimarinibacterium flocculans]